MTAAAGAPPTSPCPTCGTPITSFSWTYAVRRGWHCLYRCCGHLWRTYTPPRKEADHA